MARKVFIPEDIELEIGNFGIFVVPGDLKTETVLELQEVSQDLKENDMDSLDEAKTLLIDILSIMNDEKEVEKLNEKLGLIGTINIFSALMNEFNNSADDTKNAIESQQENPQD